MSTLHNFLNDKSHLDKSNTNESSNSTKKIKENESNLKENKENSSKLDASLVKREGSVIEDVESKEKSVQKILNRSKNSSNLVLENNPSQHNLSRNSVDNNMNNNSNLNISAKNSSSPIKPDKSKVEDLSDSKKKLELDKVQEKVLSNSSKLSKTSLKSMPDMEQVEYKNENFKNNKYTLPKKKNEEDEFSHIRIVRSYEDKDLRQNIEQFDIEYMCRCLGLALMKHIESSKDKFHILELINVKEKFDFFSSIFNMNFEFFNTFMNLENKISNLEKLDDYFKLTEGNKIDIKYFQEQEKPKYKKTPEAQISYMSHMKYANDKREDVEILSEKSKIIGDISKIEKIDIPEEIIQENIEIDDEMKTINEFFKQENIKPNVNPHKYKNLCEKTKNILNADLSAIKEVDSIDYVNKNLLQTVEKSKPKKFTTEYIDLLQDSATQFFTENDPKKLEEIMNKVIKILQRLLKMKRKMSTIN